jgi:hypothetical protein
VRIPIGGNFGFGYRCAGADGCAGGFVYDVRQQFLIAEIGCFLKHQLIIPKDAIIDGQGNSSNALIMSLNLEAVLAMSNVREDSNVSQLQNQIFRHAMPPSFEKRTFDKIESLLCG